MSNILIELDTVRKYRNKEEYRPVGRAICKEFGIEVTNVDKMITKVVKLLGEKKCDIQRGLEVRRGDTLCFEVMPLKQWLFPTDKRPEHLKRKRSE